MFDVAGNHMGHEKHKTKGSTLKEKDIFRRLIFTIQIGVIIEHTQ